MDITTQLLSAMLDLPVRPITVRDYLGPRRRKYIKAGVDKHRDQIREEEAAGVRRLSKANLRDALADAALAMLAGQAAGSDDLVQALRDAFPGVDDIVTVAVKRGQRKPR